MTPDTPVQWHETIDSTNLEAGRLAARGHYGPLWIAAKEQTSGRGRLGRQWQSPAGNLYCTALFLEPGGVQVATRFPFAAGLAVVDVCRRLVPETNVQLKWPNDVRIAGAKLCGILVESGTLSGHACWVAAGMGINVAIAPEKTGQPCTSLLGLGASAGIDAAFVLDVLRAAFARRVEQARADFAVTLSDWQDVAEGLGQTIRVGKGEDAPLGVFRGLDRDGGLQLELPDGTVRTIRAGDVELVREMGDNAARD